MRKFVSTLLVMSFAVVVSSASADDAEKPKKPAEKPAAKKPAAEKPAKPKAAGNKAGALFQLPESIALSDDQKAKLEEIKKEFQPQIVELQAKSDVMTPEQKQAAKQASQDAKAAGKKGKEAQAAVEAAVKLTDEQKKQRDEAREQLSSLQKAIREKVTGILFDDQKKALAEATGKKGPKKPKN